MLKKFWDEHKVEIISITLLVLVSFYAYNLRRDAATREARMNAQIATLNNHFKELSERTYSMRAELLSNNDMQKKLVEAFGKQVVESMKDQKAVIDSLYAVTSQIQQGVADIKVDISQGGKRESDGSFSGVVLQEQRRVNGKVAPARSEVRLAYNATNPDLSQALTGSWTAYKETFKVVLGEWKSVDQGYKPVSKISRQYHKVNADGTATLVGQEDLEQVDAVQYVTKDSFKFVGGSDVPRWTFTLGVGRDLFPGANDKVNTKPVGLVDYRFTSRVGATGGFVGSNAILGLSFRMGK